MAWIAAVRHRGPTAIILSRQALPEIPGTDVPYAEGLGRGGYIVKNATGKPDFMLMATGSELSLVMEVSEALERLGKKVRVISIPCWSLFEQESASYRESILGGDAIRRVSIEAGVGLGWQKWVGPEGTIISIETFGASAPQSDLAEEFGFTVESILERLLS